MDIEEIKSALSSGRGVNQEDWIGSTLIHYAKDVDSLRYLVERGAVVYSQIFLGYTALTLAVREGCIKKVEFLKKYTPKRYFEKALDAAVKNYRNLEVLRSLVEEFEEIPIKILETLYDLLMTGRYGEIISGKPGRVASELDKVKRACQVINTRKYAYWTEQFHYGIILFNLPYIKENWHAFPEKEKELTALWGLQFKEYELVKFSIDNWAPITPRTILLSIHKQDRPLDYVVEMADEDAVLGAVRTLICRDNAEDLKTIMMTRDIRCGKIHGVYLLPYSVLSGAIKCFQLLLECGVAPYHFYPRGYGLGPLEAAGAAADLPQDISDEKVMRFFVENGPGSAREINETYSNKNR